MQKNIYGTIFILFVNKLYFLNKFALLESWLLSYTYIAKNILFIEVFTRLYISILIIFNINSKYLKLRQRPFPLIFIFYNNFSDQIVDALTRE